MLKKIILLLSVAILLNAIFFSLLWIHRKFVMGLNPFLAPVMMVLLLLIITTLMVITIKRSIRYCQYNPGFSPATLFLLGFFVFLISDLAVVMEFGPSSFDFQLHDTYFVITNLHAILFPGLLFLLLSAIYFFYPRIAGRSMNTPMGYVHFGVTLVGSYLLFWPAHYEGVAGMPRRYFDYADWRNNLGFSYVDTYKINVAVLLICGQLLFLFNLIYSAFKGTK